MASITEPNPGLAELVNCLQGIAKVLRTLSADHPESPDKLEDFSKRLCAVAAQHRGRRGAKRVQHDHSSTI